MTGSTPRPRPRGTAAPAARTRNTPDGAPRRGRSHHEPLLARQWSPAAAAAAPATRCQHQCRRSPLRDPPIPGRARGRQELAGALLLIAAPCLDRDRRRSPPAPLGAGHGRASAPSAARRWLGAAGARRPPAHGQRPTLGLVHRHDRRPRRSGLRDPDGHAQRLRRQRPPARRRDDRPRLWLLEVEFDPALERPARHGPGRGPGARSALGRERRAIVATAAGIRDAIGSSPGGQERHSAPVATSSTGGGAGTGARPREMARRSARS